MSSFSFTCSFYWISHQNLSFPFIHEILAITFITCSLFLWFWFFIRISLLFPYGTDLLKILPALLLPASGTWQGGCRPLLYRLGCSRHGTWGPGSVPVLQLHSAQSLSRCLPSSFSSSSLPKILLCT